MVRSQGIQTYTPQNNLWATIFIFPLIITKMRPSSFKIISWAKLEVSALFQSAQHVRNMFSYKSVNGTNNARPKDYKKNGNFQNNDFYPKMKFFHNTGKILCLMKQYSVTLKIMQTQLSFEWKAHRYGQRKRPTFWEAKNASKVPHRQWIICRGYL